MKKIRFAVIGLGERGRSLIKGAITPVSDVDIVGLCDLREDRIKAAEEFTKSLGHDPFCSKDWKVMLKETEPDAVLIASDWDTHVDMACYCMEAGVIPAVEVCGAYAESDCRRLVDTYERTKTEIMLMENCCFGKEELLATSMVRNGLLGDIVHCAGAYAHDLRSLLEDKKSRNYRLDYYFTHNCDNYPTHELGPIAKLLGINRGNRMVSLVSVASKAEGQDHYAETHRDTVAPRKEGEKVIQGDIVTTLIKCENGESVTMRLDTTLPRFYNREFTVRGTKGMYEAANNIVYLDGMDEWFETKKNYRTYFDNGTEYEAKYLPKEWREITERQIKAGHGGMDGVEFRAFFKAVRENRHMPVDVYDMAAWYAITYLSEKSIAEGGKPQAIPDFTGGKYKTRPLLDVVDIEKVF